MRHFTPRSYPITTQRISCDKEIGSVKNGWHACNAKAHFEKYSATGQDLHYCKKHAPYGSASL